MENLYLDIDVVRDASGELRANVDFSRYVGLIAPEFLRKIDAAILYSLEPQLNALGWVKERTCHDFGGEEGTNGEMYDFACSACGYLCDLPEPNFCPNCGAKVVEE